MNDLYYIEYQIYDVIGQAYVINTGFGILELGVMENGKVWEEQYLTEHSTIEQYVEDRFNHVISYTKVL